MKDPLAPDDIRAFGTRFIRASKEILGHVKIAMDAQTSLPRYNNYPTIYKHENRMPSISEIYYTNAPPNYGALFRGTGLLSLGADFPEERFPDVKALVDWMNSHDKFRAYFSIPGISEAVSRYAIYEMLAEIADRYVHHFGTADFDKEKFLDIFRPIGNAILWSSLRLSVVVPIAVTAFDFDHVRLSESCYIFRMRDPFQVARSRAKSYGSAAHPSVRDAATHAFVSHDWHLANEHSYFDTTQTLRRLSAYPIEYIDRFFAALRMATQHETGYAQMLFVPRKWTFSYFANLPPLYGLTIRRYPSSFDNYG